MPPPGLGVGGTAMVRGKPRFTSPAALWGAWVQGEPAEEPPPPGPSQVSPFSSCGRREMERPGSRVIFFCVSSSRPSGDVDAGLGDAGAPRRWGMPPLHGVPTENIERGTWGRRRRRRRREQYREILTSPPATSWDGKGRVTAVCPVPLPFARGLKMARV